jgi:hypothetical protein
MSDGIRFVLAGTAPRIPAYDSCSRRDRSADPGLRFL